MVFKAIKRLYRFLTVERYMSGRKRAEEKLKRELERLETTAWSQRHHLAMFKHIDEKMGPHEEQMFIDQIADAREKSIALRNLLDIDVPQQSEAWIQLLLSRKLERDFDQWQKTGNISPALRILLDTDEEESN